MRTDRDPMGARLRTDTSELAIGEVDVSVKALLLYRLDEKLARADGIVLASKDGERAGISLSAVSVERGAVGAAARSNAKTAAGNSNAIGAGRLKEAASAVGGGVCERHQTRFKIPGADPDAAAYPARGRHRRGRGGGVERGGRAPSERW